ncbi:hypothetical protein [Algoriphagus pacificus]|uniref:Uncharacterized protein n=1 Tax=Algoriphagus pacificus TaxID=2811234 RepID=A0ABS3CK51_9BACT|nr:hypothetical protein [Algoriphagus pacificus]MBN7817460.1 hypothetical protein [Algoriphagus pacificus]
MASLDISRNFSKFSFSTGKEVDTANPHGEREYTCSDGKWTAEGGTLDEFTVSDSGDSSGSSSEGAGLTKGGIVSEFGSGFVDGFGGGVDSTVDFFKSLTTEQGWKDLGIGMVDFAMLGCQTCPQGMLMRSQLANNTYSYIQNIPNMTAYQMGYDFGFGSEKALEILATRKLVGSFKTYPRANGFGFDFGSIRFDVHTFRLGGRKTGYNVWRPHIDIPGKVKHWPWHQIDKWKRGV